MDSQQIQLLTPDNCWFQAPSEKSPDFFGAYAPAARALQRALRSTIPPMLLADAVEFQEHRLSFSLLVYGASRPFRGLPKSEFHYDVLDPAAMDLYFRVAAAGLKRSLTKVFCELSAAGPSDLAFRYHPEEFAHILRDVRRLKRHRKPLYQMLVTDALLFNELVLLGGHPHCPPKQRANLIAHFSRRWNMLLHRFCLKYDLTAAGPKLLRAATEAMQAHRPARDLEQLAA